MVIAWSSFLYTDIIATAPTDNSYVNKSGGGIKELPIMMKNGQIRPKIEFSGKWQENGVVIAWSSFLTIDIIKTAPFDNIFANKIGGIKGSPMSWHKW